MIPRCIKKFNKACPTHQSGKYLKWSCGRIYSPEERRQIFLSKKVPCPMCQSLIAETSSLCGKCNGKINPVIKKGTKLPDWWCQRISDGQGKEEKSPNWKGNNVVYWTKHKWLVKTIGNPKKCSDCGVLGEKNMGGRWSIHWANISGKYERNVSDYKGLCGKCHCLFDKKIKTVYDYKHGEVGRYRKGCRCSKCKMAKKINRKLYQH